MKNRVALVSAASVPLGTATVSGVEILKVFPIGGLVGDAYDYIAVTYPSDTQEVYTFKTGGSGGTTVSTVTVNYVDSSKAQLLNVAAT